MSTIEEVLADERKQTKVNINGLSEFLYTPEELPRLKEVLQLFKMPYDFNLFNKSRMDLIKESYRLWPEAINRRRISENLSSTGYLLGYYVQLPATVHRAMFTKCIEIMGTDRQRQQYLSKCNSFQMVGCYAQTEMGHGSDVQSLQTTATYVNGKDQFIINTPSVSAAKYWPGDLGSICTHALVYAQLISNGKNHGVHAFIVPVRDQKTLEALPGIQIGDIGPKIGFHTKDNGYLLMNNIIIPKTNMLRRFISVSKSGQIKKKGDPKVSYATMMTIRQAISCFTPKMYSQAIIIAARYSVFRKQFTDKYKQQIKIIDYQTQKDKIITRIAQYYAIMTGGNSIKAISDENLRLVTDQGDFSLMNQTHVCLCLGKALYSQTVYDGMQICRRACGGHGFHHYSGIPSLLSEYSPNITYQGQNTVLYLQISRYLLKSYRSFMTKQKSLGDSVKYIQSYDHLLQKRIEEDKEDPLRWNMEDLRILLAQTVCYLISRVTYKMMNKPDGVSDTDVWNGAAGIDLRRLGMAHAYYYTYDNFAESVFQVKHEQNREVLTDLCLLYGAHVILNFSSGVMEGGFVTAKHMTSLLGLKQILLDKLRPQIIGLVDAFAIPEHLIRSALTHGNPYENCLNLARKCEINEKISESAFLIRKNLPNLVAKDQKISPKL